MWMEIIGFINVEFISQFFQTLDFFILIVYKTYVLVSF